MIPKTASEYLQTFAQMLLSTQVTDGEGCRLPLDEGADRAVEALERIRTDGGKVFLVGNGGSASIASHIQNDLCKAAGIRAMVFNEPPLLTAFANDIGYETVFERPIELWAAPGDILLAISSSGRSQSILRAVNAAVTKRCRIVTFSGFRPDNPLRARGHINFYVASDVYGHVEVAHSALAHFLADRLMAAGRPAGQAA